MTEHQTEEELIPISEAALRLGVSIDTLRRWDTGGRLRATRKSPCGTRYYSQKTIVLFLHELFKMAFDWAVETGATEIPSLYYSRDSATFQSRLIKMQNLLVKIPGAEKILSLLVAVTGEIGNNSFDHNLGNWPDVPGVFFGYDLEKKEIVLADRGLGVLRTLQRVRPQLASHEEALKVAFTEVISSRSPEARGNGLKFVKKVIAENPISLVFQSGDTELEVAKDSSDLQTKKAQRAVQGCVAFITF